MQFKMDFLESRVLYFDSYITDWSLKGLIDQVITMMPNMQLASTWTNEKPVHLLEAHLKS